MNKFLALSLSEVAFIMLINVKMPAIVGILTFISMINFVLSWVEHGKKFYNLGAWAPNENWDQSGRQPIQIKVFTDHPTGW